MNKRTSLKDIAERVGVSTTLVSYVINGKFQDRINKDTAAKIRAVAKELNYRPNQIARSLKIQETKTIGLIVSDISNPFSSTIARIIEHEAKKHGYYILFASAGETAEKAGKLIDVLLSRQVDGLIIAPPAGLEKKLMKLTAQGVPFVLIDRYFQGLNVNYVSIDNFEASFEAINHLMENGYKNIGLLNYQSKLFNLEERNRGYRDALREVGLKVQPKNFKEIDEAQLEDSVQEAIDKLLEQRPKIDSLFFTSNRIALAGLAYLGSLKVRIPQDLAIVCFDDNEALQLFPTEITVIRQPHKEIGKAAVDLLLDAINHPDRIQTITLKSELIIRESSLNPEKIKQISC